jgi:hypothetical protein
LTSSGFLREGKSKRKVFIGMALAFVDVHVSICDFSNFIAGRQLML